MKIVAIIGSPHKNGTISKLAKQILKGAEQSGVKCELINLYDYNIQYCKGCWACSKKGTCILKDDFEEIFQKIKDADVIILGSPVYWANISGIMKNFFDRLTFAMNIPKNAEKYYKLSKWNKIKTMVRNLIDYGPKYENFKQKRYILITAATVPFKHLMNEIPPAITAMKKYVEKLGGSIYGKIVYSDTLFRFNNKKEDRMMKKALNMGKKLGKE